jgi:hypothetical protein
VKNAALKVTIPWQAVPALEVKKGHRILFPDQTFSPFH